MRTSNTLQRLVTLVFGIVEAILSLRFFLKLGGANPANGFVNWVYETSGQLLKPFFNIFPASQLEGRYVIEFSTLFAILVYGLIALGLAALIRALTPDEPVVVEETVPAARTRTTKRKGTTTRRR